MAGPVSLEIEGLDALIADLRNLPRELVGPATGIVLDTGQAAKVDIAGQYPSAPPRKNEPGGALRAGVRMEVKAIGQGGVVVQVASAARHAWLWEHGSQARHYITKRGARHETGSMPKPPAPVFIPTMIRHRAAMYAKLAALIRSLGLEVQEAA